MGLRKQALLLELGVQILECLAVNGTGRKSLNGRW